MKQGRQAGNQLIFDRLLQEGVITQEVYDAIKAWMEQQMPQTQQPAGSTQPANGTEPPALPDGTQPAEGSGSPSQPDGAEVPENPELKLLKDLLDNGVITQEQYDQWVTKINSSEAAPLG